MAAGQVREYRLAPAALADLEQIWRFSAEQWSPDQADQYIETLEETFRLLVLMPEMARERHEIRPPVRIQRSARHLVIYHIENEHISILRVLGDRQDWQSVLQAED